VVKGSIIGSMVVDMNEKRLVTLEQLKAFLAATTEVEFQGCGQDEDRYRHIEGVLKRLGYGRLKKPDKGVVLRYLGRTTGYSRQQLTRLVARCLATGRLAKAYRAPAKGLSGASPKPTWPCWPKPTACTVPCPARRRGTSCSGRWKPTAMPVTRAWRRSRSDTSTTSGGAPATATAGRPSSGPGRPACPSANAGRRRPMAVPASSIDSVHQGDQDGIQGVYHLNAVDCLTQWDLVATCEKLSEIYLLPVIQALLDGFPFRMLGFHADNGSEYINHQVARMLDKLRVEFTKSRPRHSNDNGLAETKNGAVIRKRLGYSHLPQRFAAEVNAFCAEQLNPYLNFHRPCLFAEEVADKGKVRKRYPLRLVMTPFEKLQSLAEAAAFLKPGSMPCAPRPEQCPTTRPLPA